MTQTYQITVTSDNSSFIAKDNQNLLVAMEASNQSSITVGCRGGGCGRCRIRILEGTYTTKPMSRTHITADDQDQGLALACRVFACSDMVLTPEPAPPIKQNTT